MQARTISHPRCPWLTLTVPLVDEPARDGEAPDAAAVSDDFHLLSAEAEAKRWLLAALIVLGASLFFALTSG